MLKSHAKRSLAILAFATAAVGSAAQPAAQADTVAATDIDTFVPVAADTAAEPPKPQFGYISYATALRSMSGYAEAQARLDTLRSRYGAEAHRAAEEFNSQYEEFLDEQDSYPQSILRKRQTELQELLKRNVAFSDESRRLLAEAEKDIFAPLHERLRAAIRTVGRQQRLAFIINIDDNACPFIDSSLGENVTLMVIDKLK